MLYFVILWDEEKRIKQFINRLEKANKYARRQGHNGTSNGVYYAANAYVADEDGFVVYCPRYRVGKHDDLAQDPKLTVCVNENTIFADIEGVIE